MKNLVDLYSDYSVAPISYATVRDYCDSFDNMTELATKAFDLKDVQRPWTIKTILGCLPIGSRLLEIGAGEPIVAALLAQLGYEVTVVDPYDGSGNGPIEFEQFQTMYPQLQFIRRQFGEDIVELEPGSFECIYSISVLEHIPIPEIRSVCSAIRKFLVPRTGRTIHAVDHVVKGPGAAYHLEHLLLLADLLIVDKQRFMSLLDRMQEDEETYFLSAESHNRWRGNMKYEDFPMRQVVSLQFNLVLS